MRRALIIGIDNYPQSPLTGCVNDANRMKNVLSRNHDRSLNFECEILTDPPTMITRAILRKSIFKLFRNPADIAFLHFSGHGLIHGIGGYLVTPDATDGDVGIAMSEVLAIANESVVHEVFITLDCCHSGAFGQTLELENEKVVLADGISIITATRGDQESLEEGGSGVFTSLLVEALEGGAASLLGEVNAASIYSYIENALGAWQQRPMFKANVSKFTELRKTEPRIRMALLRKLTDYFPLPAEELYLSPSYEPTVEPHDTTKENIFKDLIELRYAGLVEPVEENYMYDVAMKSKCCRLSTLGRYYWRLINDNKL